MLAANLEALAQNLEKQELENAASGATVSPQLYSQLLAIYLLQNDLNNAKYLWKRIPQSIKTTHPEIFNIWKVGQKMWQRDFPGIYEALNRQWSNDVAEIMQKLLEKTHQRAANLVATAYSSLSVDALAAFTGLSIEEAIQQGLDAGWQIDRETNIVKPCRPVNNIVQVVSCEDQISKLTDFVSFLEN
ncbi:COP9 signalosome complex subunit, putative [Pediculus humanus corporis]|uniref:COP9 signalosome complex subunit 8 n=1 Tax=Pediculus humanus subsp. corporis TaxID=121224 RepID=E0VBW8_PEDHC|nr:COP9 signalosome complex subunit, putative [Pediculus humanus corporis]EEB10874.1 COP9 signalosome complex subunit, putative [Pediculus humanus corporis]